MSQPNRPVPVILDTDIGGDIDDTWAIAQLLKCPELDVRLIASDWGDTVYRAKLIARLLEVAERTDIPVAVGICEADQPVCEYRQGPWVENYDLDAYPGTVHYNGVDAIVRTIMDSPEPITLICIGPVTNIAACLEQEPLIAERTRFVGVFGSLYRQHHGEAGGPECNIVTDAPSCQRVFQAPWRELIVTPMDTCSFVELKGERYRRLYEADDALLQAVVDNYRIWVPLFRQYVVPDLPCDPATESSILFDTVAVYLAFCSDLLVMERMTTTITDDGRMVIDAAGREMDVAIDWRDLDGFEEWLTERLLAPVVR